MTQFVDTESGEVYEGPCPECERVKDEAEIQVRKMEQERRSDRIKVGKLERQADRDAVKARDGATWKRTRDAWLEAFPDKRPTATGIKSARATQVFLRLEQGASEDDIMAAIQGAKAYPFVVFGKRRATGPPTDRMDDLQDIAAVNNDRMFDWLVEAGKATRAPF